MAKSNVRIEIQGAIGSGKSELASLISKYLESLNLDVTVQQNQGVVDNLSKNQEELVNAVKGKITITELNTFN